jgi:hypothetical protein
MQHLIDKSRRDALAFADSLATLATTKTQLQAQATDTELPAAAAIYGRMATLIRDGAALIRTAAAGRSLIVIEGAVEKAGQYLETANELEQQVLAIIRNSGDGPEVVAVGTLATTH